MGQTNKAVVADCIANFIVGWSMKLNQEQIDNFQMIVALYVLMYLKNCDTKEVAWEDIGNLTKMAKVNYNVDTTFKISIHKMTGGGRSVLIKEALTCLRSLMHMLSLKSCDRERERERENDRYD